MGTSRSLRATLCLLTVVMATAGCNQTKAPTDADRSLIHTRWVVDKVASAGASVDPGHEAYLIFDGVGGFTGSTGCTPVNGTAVIAIDQITVSVSGTPTCTEDERLPLHNAVLATLRGDVSYRIDWQRLMLSGPTGKGLTLQASN